MKPILFNTEMVKAILDSQKTVTRRIMKPQPFDTEYCNHELVTFNDMLPGYYDGDYTCACRKCGYGIGPSGESVFKPPYIPGDILYVRETWRVLEASYPPRRCKIEYRAGGTKEFNEIIALPTANGEWKPSIHMPQKAARLFLRVKNVRVERLQDIDDNGVVAEGLHIGDPFDELWDSTIKKADRDRYGWDANPWVWVIEYER